MKKKQAGRKQGVEKEKVKEGRERRQEEKGKNEAISFSLPHLHLGAVL